MTVHVGSIFNLLLAMPNITNILGAGPNDVMINSVIGNIGASNVQINSRWRGSNIVLDSVSDGVVMINGKVINPEPINYLEINGVRYRLPEKKEDMVAFLRRKADEIALQSD